MKNFDWQELLSHHPFFSSLPEQEIEQLLAVSRERDEPPGSVILRQGQWGDLLFLIGVGSVQVVLQRDDSAEVLLSVLSKGQIFGEMALFQHRPRVATVVAKESCILLEVKGQEFLELVRQRPSIEVKVLLMLSERLRHINEQVTAVQVRHIEEKLDILNARLDADLKVFDASLRAAQTVFEQTKIRAEEVIRSAEHRRTQLETTLKVGMAILALVGAIAGWFGVSKYEDLKAIETNVRGIKGSIEEAAGNAARTQKEVEQIREQTQEHAKKVREDTGEISRRKTEIEHLSSHLRRSVLPQFTAALKNENTAETMALYESLLDTRDRLLVRRVLGEIEKGMVKTRNKAIYNELLAKSVQEISWPLEKITAYTLLLILKILHGEEDYQATFYRFRDYIAQRKDCRPPEQTEDCSIKAKLDFSLFVDVFADQDQQKQALFEEVKRLIP